jgi:hypothetical protein
VEPVTPLRHDPIPQHQAGSVGPLMRRPPHRAVRRPSRPPLAAAPSGKRISMTIESKTTALLGAIERRLTDISEQQHALAVEESPAPGAAHAVAAGDCSARYRRGPAQGQRGHAPGTDGGLVRRPASAACDSEDGRLHTPRGVPHPLTYSEMAILATRSARDGSPGSPAWVRRYVTAHSTSPRRPGRCVEVLPHVR